MEPIQLPALPLKDEDPEKALDKLEKDTLKEIQKILKDHDFIETDIGIIDYNRYWVLKNHYRLLLTRPNRKV